jgi:hypothetical protein
LTEITVDTQNPAYASIDGVLFDKTIQTIIAYPAKKNAETFVIPSSVTSIKKSAFIGCISLTSITIPPSVTDIGNGAFWECSSLTSITIPSSVTDIGDWVFASCGNLENITVDSLNPAYASIDGVLFNKNIRAVIAYPAGKNAETYTIPSSVTNIIDFAFLECVNLTSVIIPPSVTSIGFKAFGGCDNLTSVTLSRETRFWFDAFPDSTQIIYRD